MPARFVDCPEGVLSISDAEYFWVHPVEVSLAAPARLRMSVVEDGGVREVRLLPEGVGVATRELVEELLLDQCVVFVCDRDSWVRALRASSDEAYAAYRDALYTSPGTYGVSFEGCPDGVCFPASGRRCDVYALRDVKGDIVGADIVARADDLQSPT
ncbi:MAG: hypothetical protein H6724_07095 [Sandaracinus sp.]|nr:hypothetical protein [Myxococcales bacterium]MCB9599203.1 hypothetical protein [Sandaracinus sp.]MCB9619203.1 hypothetical protein [Sandaracinus sp.]